MSVIPVTQTSSAHLPTQCPAGTYAPSYGPSLTMKGVPNAVGFMVICNRHLPLPRGSQDSGAQTKHLKNGDAKRINVGGRQSGLLP